MIAYLRSNWLLLLLLALCIGRLWLMPLPSSFWTDEMGTAFIVERPTDPSLAAVPQLPVSIYYSLPRVVHGLFGFSEVGYRLPSVLFMGIALLVVARLAARLIHPAAGWFAVFGCLALGDLDYYAADARPYALGICVACLTVYFLIRWLDTEDWKQALLFVVFGALLWRVQLVYWPFYPILLVYTILRLGRRSFKAVWFYALLGLAMLPVAFQAIHIFQVARSHTFAPMPSLAALPQAFSWKMVAFWAAAGLLFGRRKQQSASVSDLVLIVLWWLWLPFCMFAFSRATGTVLFVPRYFSLILPGTALATTAAVALFLPRERWKMAAVLMAIGALVAEGHWHSVWFDHTQEDWRQAALNADLAAEPDTPVLVVSPFVEAQPPVWSPQYSLPGFLYSPLFVYPVGGRVYPFPFIRDPRSEDYARKLVSETLSQKRRFLVYGAGRNTAGWILWLAARPELAGWHVSQSGAGVVGVSVFDHQ